MIKALLLSAMLIILAPLALCNYSVTNISQNIKFRNGNKSTTTTTTTTFGTCKEFSFGPTRQWRHDDIARSVPEEYRRDKTTGVNDNQKESNAAASFPLQAGPGAYAMRPTNTQHSSIQDESSNHDDYEADDDDNGITPTTINERNENESWLLSEDDPESALEAQVVPERDFNNEVQERMKAIAIDPLTVEVKTKDNSGAAPKTSVLLIIIGLCLMALMVAIGTTVGIKNKKERLANASNIRFPCPDFNALNGTLPSELYALSSLEVLSLNGGSLQGNIPPSLGKLTRLDTLHFAQNLLTGTTPESFSDLRRLKWLNMDYNTLTGSFPPILSIEFMSLESNLLSGTIPGSVTFGNLLDMNLSCNMMSGSIPESLFSRSLEVLVLWENNFSGSLSSKIGDLVQMNYMDLTNNDITGTIPSEIGALNMLGSLYLDRNSFNGTIPSEMGLLTGLWDGLWLSYNQLSGTVPDELSVDCENVEEAGSVDVCNPRQEDTDGPLTVFALQDQVFLQGCPQRMFLANAL
jgi:Leucine rich repeat